MTDYNIEIGPAGFPRDVAAAPRRTLYARGGKRLFDVVCSATLLALLSPLMLVVFAGLAPGGAPVFSHGRVGMGHRAFRCFKFRSMRRDSARMLRFLLRTDPAAADEWAEAQKLAEDPRITRMGNFLRRTSIDELPQLFNVLRGDMSMVGPRPVTEGELRRYGSRLPLYLAVRPGLTGVWQVHGRGVTSFEERVDMDCAYVRDVALWGDLKLVLLTVNVVLRRSGT